MSYERPVVEDLGQISDHVFHGQPPPPPPPSNGFSPEGDEEP